MTPRPSRTAEYMALFRAIESCHPTPLFEDPLATAFLDARLGLVARVARTWVGHRLVTSFIDRRWPGPRGAAIARTRFIDDAVESALREGFEQVAILGAGYDCRAYRLPGAAGARFFEIDHPATQVVKQSRLVEALGGLPPGVTFVGMDFERDSLQGRLAEGGLKGEKSAVFVWEGVTNYLTAEAVDQTFRALGRLGLPTCRVVFTYMHRGVIDGSVAFADAPRWVGQVSRVGEPFRFGFLPEELPGYLEQRGFRLRQDVTTAEAGRRYFGPLGRRERGSDLYHLAVAEISGPAPPP